MHEIVDHFFLNISITEEVEGVGLKLDFPENRNIDYFRRHLERVIRKDLKIDVTPFMNEMEFEIESLKKEWDENSKTPFWFTGVKNIVKSKEFLRLLLEEAYKKGVNILVLPELVIDNHLLEFLKEWLKKNNRDQLSLSGNGMLMVVAGSFHIAPDKNVKDERYNISHVLDHGGNILWSQKKLNKLTINSEELNRAPGLKNVLKISDEGGYESIFHPEHLLCVDTVIGRIAITICIDFFDDGHQEALRQSGINIFFVPAMNSTISRFEHTARSLGGSNQASSFVANKPFFSKPQNSVPGKRDSPFYYIPDTRHSCTYAVGEDSFLLVYNLKPK